jgi:hypothetical protein
MRTISSLPPTVYLNNWLAENVLNLNDLVTYTPSSFWLRMSWVQLTHETRDYTQVTTGSKILANSLVNNLHPTNIENFFRNLLAMMCVACTGQ